MPKVSVIMSVYNGERFLREAIDSILNQTYKDFEFIIINDGSTDKTQEILTSYDDERMVLLDNQQNMGVPMSRNKGMRIAKGEYIAVMDADDISLPDRLEEEVKFLDSHKDIGAIGSSIYVMNMDSVNLFVHKPPTTNEELQKELIKHNCFAHGSVMLRKECLEEIESYREEFETAHDYDFLIRISERYKVANIEKSLYKWRANPWSTLTVAKRSNQVEENKLIQKLARERRAYGKDRLQIPEKRQEVIDYINAFKKRSTTRRGKSEAYLYQSRFFRQVEDRKRTFKFLIKSLILNPFNPHLWIYTGSFFTAAIRKIFKKTKSPS